MNKTTKTILIALTILAIALVVTFLSIKEKQPAGYFGNEVQGDFNRDGKIDRAYITTEQPGGSGTFYYLVTSASSNKIFLGDRIAPQSTMIDEKDPSVIIVSYAIRAANEPMITPPSIMISKSFKILNGELIEFEYNFEGEQDLIKVELPFPGAVVGKNFSVIGEARGTWFFEASFPIELLDKDGKVLAVAIAQAQDEWMTENFVPFKADIVVPETYIGKATLVMKKDNPSGLPEHDMSVSFIINIEY
jgi:hypothetical protein